MNQNLNTASIITKDAYVLFFRRVSETPHTLQNLMRDDERCQQSSSWFQELGNGGMATTVAEGLSTLATLQEDRKFIARQEELARVGRVVEAVFTSIAPAPRELLLLRGNPGLGKSAAAKQGLRLKQNQYAAASCCKDVHVPSIIRGRGAAAVREDLVRWGRDLGSKIGVGSASSPDAVLPRLKEFLQKVRYVVLIDDADEAGLREALKHLPPSQLRCALLVTSQMLKQTDTEALVSASESRDAGHMSSIRMLELAPFTDDECIHLLDRFCPPDASATSFPSYAPLHAHGAQLQAAFEKLERLPLAVRFFCVWLRGRFQDEMKAEKQKAAAAFDEAAAGTAVVKALLVEWDSTSSGIVLAAGAEHSRGLQGTARLALQSLKSHALAPECCQLLAFLALRLPVQTPWSLFDGGVAGQLNLLTQGRRVVVEGQTLGHVSVEGKSCRIPKLKLEAVAVSNDVKEGGKIVVRLKDGKVINVKGIDLLFEGDAAAVDIEGHWMLPRRLGGQAQGRVMRQEADGSISVLFQGPHDGCHVQLQGLTIRTDLNGCFGYVCGACDAATQRWPVRVTLASDEVKDMLLKAGNLVCTGKVMARDGKGRPRAVPAFASGCLTVHRPGAEVMRFKREDVKGARAEGVLAGVTDALGDVAAALESSGLVEVDEAGRLFSMHQLLQEAVRAEVGQAHDDGMAALLETAATISSMGAAYSERSDQAYARDMQFALRAICADFPRFQLGEKVPNCRKSDYWVTFNRGSKLLRMDFDNFDYGIKFEPFCSPEFLTSLSADDHKMLMDTAAMRENFRCFFLHLAVELGVHPVALQVTVVCDLVAAAGVVLHFFLPFRFLAHAARVPRAMFRTLEIDRRQNSCRRGHRTSIVRRVREQCVGSW